MKQKNFSFLRIVALIMVVVLGAFCLVACNNGTQTKKKVKVKKGGRPSYESVFDRDIVLPDEDDFEANKELALYLYQTANEAFKNCPSCSYSVDCLTKNNIVLTEDISSSIDCQGYRYLLKIDDEYYYTEYSIALGDAGSLMKMFAAEDTVYAIRSYTNASMDYLYTDKVLKPTMEETSSGTMKISADWTADNRVSGYPKRADKPIYCAAQEGNYRQTDQNIADGTISEALVTYNEEEGYYTVKLTLDVDNPDTTKDVIGGIQAGNRKTARYTSIKETIEIWDNGYYKRFLSVDAWEWSILQSVIKFDTYFNYDADSLDPDNYSYFAAVKKAALKQSDGYVAEEETSEE